MHIVFKPRRAQTAQCPIETLVGVLDVIELVSPMSARAVRSLRAVVSDLSHDKKPSIAALFRTPWDRLIEYVTPLSAMRHGPDKRVCAELGCHVRVD